MAVPARLGKLYLDLLVPLLSRRKTEQTTEQYTFTIHVITVGIVLRRCLTVENIFAIWRRRGSRLLNCLESREIQPP